MRRLNLNARMPHWHRYLGIAGALFFLLLAGTGILLNHTSDLALDNRHVRSDWLLAHYGLKAPAARTFPAGPNWISQLGQRLYFNEREVSADGSILVGAIAYGGMTAVATTKALWLLDESGNLIERLDSHAGLPGNPTGLGLGDAHQLALGTEAGWHATTESLFPWTPMAEAPSQIATSAQPPAELAGKLARAYLGEGLSLERVLLDLHSGRIFGPLGVYLVDLMALILSGLAITGLTVWFRRKRQLSQLRTRTETA